MQQDRSPKIRVVIRKRPLSKKEEQRGESDIVEVQDESSVVVFQQKVKVDLTPYTDEYRFNFDGAYDQNSSNEDLYRTSVKPLVESAFDGAKVTCFAYGQTGSGKTYTMLGDGASRVPGLYLLGAFDIFERLKRKQYSSFGVWISFYEIYCGKLYDLLNDRNLLFAREDAKQNVNIIGLEEKRVGSVESLMQVIEFGSGVRVTAQNGTNVDSSRSHAILQISLRQQNKPFGKLSFIDLAGSERAADHADQTYKQTRIDGAEINKSLLALKECIRALDQNKNHTPFRGSKLTMVLKDSFTGYCRTLMIGNISPNSSSCENTLNTLKYADRVKELKRPNKQQISNSINGLDELSRQLMLPRTNGPTVTTKHNRLEEEPQNVHRKDKKPQPFRRPQPPQPQPYIQKSTNPLQAKNVSPGREPYREAHQERQPQQPITLQRQQQRDLKLQPIRTREDFLQLARRHESYVQLIIGEEEEVVKCHEKHINTNIELIKAEMVLMNEADKIGSDIESYLGNLEEVLQRELSSINEMRERYNLHQGRVGTLQQHLREAEQIEKLYFKESHNYADVMQEDDDLLDVREHENLFY